MVVRGDAIDEKRSSQILEGTHLVAHDDEPPTAFNSRRLHHLEHRSESSSRMRKLASAILVLGCVSLLSVHGGFENGDFSESGLPNGFSALAMGPGYTNIAPWEIVPGVGGAFNGSVEYINAWSHDPGGACVELGYYYGTNGIQQSLDTVPNREYEVRFWLATDPWNGPRASVRVLAAGSFADYSAAPGTANQSDLGWTQKTFRFVSDDSGYTTLAFQSLI